MLHRTAHSFLGILQGSGFGFLGSSEFSIGNKFYAFGGFIDFLPPDYFQENYDYCTTIKSISLNGETAVESLPLNEGTGSPNCLEAAASVSINSTTSIITGGQEYPHNHNHKGTYYYNGETFSEGPDLIAGDRMGHAVGLLKDKDTNDEYIAVVGGRIQVPKSNGGSEINDVDDSIELLKIGDNKWKSGILIIIFCFLKFILN